MKALLAIIKGIFFLASLAALAYLWFWFNLGVSNAEVRDTVRGESLEIQARIDVRTKQLTAKIEEFDAKVSALDAKMNALDAKIDQLIKLASAPAVAAPAVSVSADEESLAPTTTQEVQE